MDLSVVILSFNTKKITDNGISKTLVSSNYAKDILKSKIEIIVVDNGSSDGTVEMIKKKYPMVRLLSLPTNLGVAQGYNYGMKNAKGNLILIINSDTYLYKDTIYDSLNFMQTHKSADAMIGYMLDGKDKFRAYGGHTPTPFRTILWLLGFESIPFIRNIIPRIYTYNKNKYKNDFNIEWAPTCFLMLKKEVYKKTLGHDEKMFLYMEDLEWCKRINDAGFKIIYTPTVKLVHLGGESTEKKLDNKSYITLLRNQIKGMRHFQKKHYPNSYFLVEFFLRFGLLTRGIYYKLTKNENMAFAYLNVLASN